MVKLTSSLFVVVTIAAAATAAPMPFNNRDLETRSPRPEALALPEPTTHNWMDRSSSWMHRHLGNGNKDYTSGSGTITKDGRQCPAGQHSCMIDCFTPDQDISCIKGILTPNDEAASDSNVPSTPSSSASPTSSPVVAEDPSESNTAVKRDPVYTSHTRTNIPGLIRTNTLSLGFGRGPNTRAYNQGYRYGGGYSGGGLYRREARRSSRATDDAPIKRDAEAEAEPIFMRHSAGAENSLTIGLGSGSPINSVSEQVETSAAVGGGVGVGGVGMGMGGVGMVPPMGGMSQSMSQSAGFAQSGLGVKGMYRREPLRKRGLGELWRKITGQEEEKPTATEAPSPAPARPTAPAPVTHLNPRTATGEDEAESDSLPAVESAEGDLTVGSNALPVADPDASEGAVEVDMPGHVLNTEDSEATEAAAPLAVTVSAPKVRRDADPQLYGGIGQKQVVSPVSAYVPISQAIAPISQVAPVPFWEGSQYTQQQTMPMGVGTKGFSQMQQSMV